MSLFMPIILGGCADNSAITTTTYKSYAYVANGDSNNVSAYAIDSATGALTSIGTPVAAGTQTQSIVTVRVAQ
jgi:6-phosphogluconolactonase (cycloisomerase 2 family)